MVLILRGGTVLKASAILVPIQSKQQMPPPRSLPACMILFPRKQTGARSPMCHLPLLLVAYSDATTPVFWSL